MHLNLAAAIVNVIHPLSKSLPLFDGRVTDSQFWYAFYVEYWWIDPGD